MKAIIGQDMHEDQNLHIRIIFKDGQDREWQDSSDRPILVWQLSEGVHIQTPNSKYFFPMSTIASIEKWYDCDEERSSEPCSKTEEEERARKIWDKA